MELPSSWLVACSSSWRRAAADLVAPATATLPATLALLVVAAVVASPRWRHRGHLTSGRSEAGRGWRTSASIAGSPPDVQRGAAGDARCGARRPAAVRFVVWFALLGVLIAKLRRESVTCCSASRSTRRIAIAPGGCCRGCGDGRAAVGGGVRRRKPVRRTPGGPLVERVRDQHEVAPGRMAAEQTGAPLACATTLPLGVVPRISYQYHPLPPLLSAAVFTDTAHPASLPLRRAVP